MAVKGRLRLTKMELDWEDRACDYGILFICNVDMNVEVLSSVQIKSLSQVFHEGNVQTSNN